MESNQNNQSLIELYLQEKLQGAELKAFESKMVADKAFGGEVAFQRSVVSGISEFRKNQLKARLDAIPVGQPWYHIGAFAQGASKIAASLMTLTVIGGGVYFSLNGWEQEKNIDHPQVDIVVEGDVPLSEQQAVSVPDKPLPNVVEDKDIQSQQKAILADSEPAIESIEEKSDVGADVAPKEEAFVPQVTKPVYNSLDESDFNADGVVMPEVADSDIVNLDKEQPMDIKTFNRKSESIRYKYFSGKLYLYGDFKHQPYEILEINSKSARKIYLYHADSYYEIEVTSDVKAPQSIKSEKLIDELEIIRNNKAN